MCIRFDCDKLASYMKYKENNLQKFSLNICISRWSISWFVLTKREGKSYMIMRALCAMISVMIALFTYSSRSVSKQRVFGAIRSSTEIVFQFPPHYAQRGVSIPFFCDMAISSRDAAGEFRRYRSSNLAISAVEWKAIRSIFDVINRRG